MLLGNYSSILQTCLTTYFTDSLPRFSIQGSGARSWHWAALSFQKEGRHLYGTAINWARSRAVRDYLLGRFGNCPISIRQLNRTITKL